MPSLWIQHVKNYARHHNITYKEALKLAKPSYSKFGTVSTEPSQISLKLNDEQYNLNTIAIKPTFKKGSTETHIVNIKYNSDEAIKIPPNPLEVIPPNPLEENIEELAIPIYSELATPIFSPSESKKPQRKNNIYNVEEIIEPQTTTITQHKIYNPYKQNKRQTPEYTEKQYNNDIEVNKFLLPSKKYKSQIKNINDKMNKIKNTDMSKYFNKKPITPKSNPIYNDPFGLELVKPKIERLQKDHPFYDILTPTGIIPFELIETPEFNNDQDKKLNFLNKLLAQHIRLLNVFKNSRMEDEDKKTLINECMMNIQTIQKYIFDVEELKDQENNEIKKITQHKNIYDTNIKALKSNFETQKQQKEQAQMGMNDFSDKPSYTKFEKEKRPTRRLPTTDKAKQQKEQAQMGMNDFSYKPSYTKFEKAKRPTRRLPTTTDKAKQQKEQAQMGMNDIKEEDEEDEEQNEKNEEIIEYFNEPEGYADFTQYFNSNADLYAFEDLLNFLYNDEISDKEKVHDLIKEQKIYNNIQEIATQKVHELIKEGGTEKYKINKLVNIGKITEQYKKRIFKKRKELGQNEEDQRKEQEAIKEHEKQIKKEAKAERIYKEQKAEKQRIEFEKYQQKQKSKKKQ